MGSDLAAIVASLRAKPSPRTAGEPVVFHDCHTCPRPGFYHGAACYVLAADDEAQRSAGGEAPEESPDA